MTMQSSGAISFSEIQSEFGGSNPISIDEYIKGGAYVGDGTSYTNYSVPFTGTYSPNIPTSASNISIDDFYGSGNVTEWDEASSPVKTAFSSSANTTFNIGDYIPDLTTGDLFAVCTSHLAATSWRHANDTFPTLACAYGTASSITVPQYYDKQWVLNISYDGANTVTIGGYYCCSGTNYPNGGAYLRSVGRR